MVNKAAPFVLTNLIDLAGGSGTVFQQRPRFGVVRDGNHIMKYFVAVAGLMGMLAVAAGAFTAHGLSTILENGGVDVETVPQRVEWAVTATDYLLIHCVGLLGCAAVAIHFPDVKMLRGACCLLLLGTLLFSGSLFCLAMTGNSVFARIAPWGGTTLMVAWLLVAIGGLLTRGPVRSQLE